LRGQRLKETLLHEMAHAASNGCHGKQWLAEMLRLAEMGAPTGKDWEAYQNKQQTMGERQITAEACNIGMETDWPWSKIRGYIGNQYGLTDARGRSESKGAARVMERCKKEFWKGRRFGLTCPPPSVKEASS
jgi:hypothetical protein